MKIMSQSELFQAERQQNKKPQHMVKKHEKEYDFSKGEKGKFYRPGMKVNITIYLKDEVLVFVEKIASKKGIDRSAVVNELLKGDIKLAKAME